MLLAALADTSTQVAATRSRNAKRGLLAAAIAAAPPDETAIAVSYLSGTLRQRRTNVGWASLPTVPAAVTPSLTLTEVDRAFEQIAAVSGTGSAGRRADLLATLLGRATAAEQHLLRGLLFSEIRQGALDALVLEALAAAFGAPSATVQRAAMLLGSTPATAELLARQGPSALEAVRLQVGVAVRPMLAASAPDVAGAVQRSGLPALVDAKLDGIRVQIHRDGPRITVFTRSLDDITQRVPEIVEVVGGIPVTDAVLDGELIALDPAGRPRPFQVTAARTASAGGSRGGVPLSLFCFDVLRLDGTDLLDRPLDDRVQVMRSRLSADLLVPRIRADSADEVGEFFADAVARGFEGVVVKKLDAPYAAGRRDSGWVKIKPRHTFDLAVTAAEWGYGRRTGLLSNLHLAARDPADGRYVMLGKTFKGLTDEMLSWQTTEIQARESRRTRSTVYADPPLVAEIACDGLQSSPRYPGGVALRFARVLRYRTDKAVEEVDTIDTVLALAGRVDGDEAGRVDGDEAGRVDGDDASPVDDDVATPIAGDQVQQ